MGTIFLNDLYIYIYIYIRQHVIQLYTTWLFDIAMENGHLIDDVS